MESYDCRVFCLETAAANNNTDMHTYQAELALSIGDGEPELCDALLALGVKLLHDPVKATTELYDMLGLEERTEQSIISAAWKATIILLFPILEQYGMDFVTKYKEVLARHLPISNSNGDRVTDPCDLEIGPLQYIVSSSGKDFSSDEVDEVKLCRKARNLLAHNKLVPYADVKKILFL